ncbi:MAG: nucleoside deaminase [Candidatus ainarchaeum sp.]|nr:nucleoside deaminase [Candidatus ainarchaeum sp.]
MDFMKIALNEAKKGVSGKHGGPFGAVIVCDNKIIAKAHNMVLKNNDPTAHAEINAIRIASKKLKTVNLDNCILYSTCEPCPMCLSAIYWSRIKKIIFSCSRLDAKKAGFDDKKIYDSFLKNKCLIEKEIIDFRDIKSFMRAYSGKKY